MKPALSERSRRWMEEFGLTGTWVEHLTEASQPFGNAVVTYSHPAILLRIVLDKGDERVEFAHLDDRDHFISAREVQIFFGEKTVEDVIRRNAEFGVREALAVFALHWQGLLTAFLKENTALSARVFDEIERELFRCYRERFPAHPA